MINFIHKKSKIKISLECLKESQGKTFTFPSYHQPTIFIEKKYASGFLCSTYNYRWDEIPFSEDFEIECIDQEFSLKELTLILDSLNKNKDSDFIDVILLMDKIENMRKIKIMNGDY